MRYGCLQEICMYFWQLYTSNIVVFFILLCKCFPMYSIIFYSFLVLFYDESALWSLLYYHVKVFCGNKDFEFELDFTTMELAIGLIYCFTVLQSINTSTLMRKQKAEYIRTTKKYGEECSGGLYT